MDPHYQIGSLNLAKCPELATYQLECDALTYRTLQNTLLSIICAKVTEERGDLFEEFAKTEGHFEII